MAQPWAGVAVAQQVVDMVFPRLPDDLNLSKDPRQARDFLAAGLLLGVLGYFGRGWASGDGFEDFEFATLVRVLTVYGAAGAVLGLSGAPPTQGNVIAAIGATVVIGEVTERLLKGLQKCR